MEWIDQADSQTIRQPGSLSNIMKASYTLKAEADTNEERWYVDRILNDAIQHAVISPAGPVHINISIAEPHTREIDVDASCSFRKSSIFVRQKARNIESAHTCSETSLRQCTDCRCLQSTIKCALPIIGGTCVAAKHCGCSRRDIKYKDG